jgi:hypothetical protein
MKGIPLAVSSASVPDPGQVGALTDALRTERRLLDELARVLIAQREGISAVDREVVDESVFAAHRLFRTLAEARERRRSLLRLLGAARDLRLHDLESAFGAGSEPDLLRSRDELLASASNLARELLATRRRIGESASDAP